MITIDDSEAGLDDLVLGIIRARGHVPTDELPLITAWIGRQLEDATLTASLFRMLGRGEIVAHWDADQQDVVFKTPDGALANSRRAP